jgi:glycosyltransferase involved in cell wall biosynthesis
MKILYIASVRIPNEKASGLAIMRQCEAFTREGASVTLMVPTRSNTITEDPFTFYGVEKVFQIKTFVSLNFYEGLGRVGFFLALISQMISVYFLLWKEGKHYDCIYTRDPWMLVLTAFFDGLDTACVEVHKTYRSRLVLHAIKRSGYLIAISGGLKRFIEEKTNRTDVSVEPSGVNVDQFAHTEDVAVLRARYSIPLDATVISYVGKTTTMGEEKGVGDIVRGFAELFRVKPKSHLLIVGAEVDEAVTLRDLSMNVGIPEHACSILPLIQRNFAEYVALSDVMVMNYPDTYHYRSFMSPTKLFAAMGAQKVIVVSKLPSIQEILAPNMAVFIEPNNQDSIVAGMVRAVSLETSEKENMTRSAREHARYFTWEYRAKRILRHITS